MKHLFRPLLLLTLAVILLVTPALAIDNPVDDPANVFSPAFSTDLAAYSRAMEDRAGIPLKVITRHFLGDKNINTFAKESLSALPEAANAVLLVMVIGEDAYAVAIGSETQKVFSPEMAESLLSNHFRTPYLTDRAYEKAVASFVLETGVYLEGRLGKSLNTGDLMTEYVQGSARKIVLPTIQPHNSDDIFGSIFEDAPKSREDARRYDEDARCAEDDSEKGLSLFQIAIIGFVLYKIIGRGNRKNNSNQRKGCGPLGWIFGTWGVSKFFGWRK